MKKVLFYVLIAIFTVIVVVAIVVESSVIHVQLPHGAVLHVLPASKGNQTHGAVILCPGGGYCYLEKWREGYWWFPFFHSQGYTVAMLEYRMPKHNYRIPVTDAIEAIKLMRNLATDSKHVEIGMMGFSAGGHLVSTLAISSRTSIRPDFTILFYPVISMKSDLTHKWTHDNLLGINCTQELEDMLSSNLHITKDTPPVFIAVSANDSVVKPANGFIFHRSMIKNNRQSTLKIYPSGGHGFGFKDTWKYHDLMLKELETWLKE